MSKPVSNNEMEDVLSSIRRLVSENKRPLQVAKMVETNNRLVLTPALRVAHDDERDRHDRENEQVSRVEGNAQDSLESKIASDEFHMDVHDRVAERPEDGVAAFHDASDDMKGRHEEADAAHSDSDHEGHAAQVIPASWQEDDLSEDHTSKAFWDDEQSETADQNLHEPQVEESATDDADSELVAHADREDATNDDAQADGVTETDTKGADNESVASSAAALTAKIAALETAVGSFRQEWEPDDPGRDAYAGTGGPILNWEDNVELDALGKPVVADTPLDEDAQADEIEEVAFEADDLGGEQHIETEQKDESLDGSVSDSEEIAEATVFRHRASTEVDSDMSRDFEELPPEDGAADAWIADDLAEAEEASQTAAGSDDTSEADFDLDPEIAGLAAGFSAEDAVLDEEALRDLVSEIVRSELQGALGERITRNVRKLVRREIHRALAAQELD